MIKELFGFSEVHISVSKTPDNHSYPQFMTVAQVASILSVSNLFVRRLLRDGFLSGVKLGSAKNSPVRIAGRSLENLLETYKVTEITRPKKTARKSKSRRPYRGVFGK